MLHGILQVLSHVHSDPCMPPLKEKKEQLLVILFVSINSSSSVLLPCGWERLVLFLLLLMMISFSPG